MLSVLAFTLSPSGLLDMPTPQIAAAAPDHYCPRCGRRMQFLKATESSYHYACYSHSPQNAGTIEPYYLNVPYKSLDQDGRIKEREDKSAIRAGR